MILLLIDVGNTRVKWTRLLDGRMGKQYAVAHTTWSDQQLARRVIGRGWTDADGRILVSSVASDEVNARLRAAARAAGAPEPEFVAVERSAAGVTTDYLEPWRLGVDRFLAAIGAYHLASGQPVCVASAGTALTLDLVDGRGRHRGGVIVPSPDLMVESLLSNTQGIRRRARGGPEGGGGFFAKTTRAAIGRGALYASAAVIDRAIEEARVLVGRRPLVLLTGGGSQAIKPLLLTAAVIIPELVLHGLAVWAKHTPRSTAGGPGRSRRA